MPPACPGCLPWAAACQLRASAPDGKVLADSAAFTTCDGTIAWDVGVKMRTYNCQSCSGFRALGKNCSSGLLQIDHTGNVLLATVLQSYLACN